MEIPELNTYMNETFGLTEWPETMVVDVRTFSNVCKLFYSRYGDGEMYCPFGPNGGIVYKNVELILQETVEG